MPIGAIRTAARSGNNWVGSVAVAGALGPGGGGGGHGSKHVIGTVPTGTLVAKIKPGENPSLADLTSGAADIGQVADILSAAQPTGPDPAYTTATLTTGRYVLLSPIGTPPDHITGTIAAEVSVT